MFVPNTRNIVTSHSSYWRLDWARNMFCRLKGVPGVSHRRSVRLGFLSETWVDMEDTRVRITLPDLLHWCQWPVRHEHVFGTSLQICPRTRRGTTTTSSFKEAEAFRLFLLFPRTLTFFERLYYDSLCTPPQPPNKFYVVLWSLYS